MSSSFSRDQVDQIRRSVSAVEIAREAGLALTQKGSDWWLACPWHDEKTPSLKIDRAGFWICFGCQAKGQDGIAFAQKLNGWTFPEAVEHLAPRASVVLDAAAGDSRGGRGVARRSRDKQRGNVDASRPTSTPPSASPPTTAEVRPIEDARGALAGAELVATYPYVNRAGKLLYEVQRYRLPDGRKTFRQRRPDGKGGWIGNMKDRPTVLYRIPDVAAALDAGDTVAFVEGEKDANTLFDAGYVATCNTGGAGKWRAELAKPFVGTRNRLMIIRDRDEPGEKHAQAVFESLSKVAPDAEISIWEAREGKDVTDHLGTGLTFEQLVQVHPIPDDLVETDPRRFKVIQLDRALHAPIETLKIESNDLGEGVDPPLFPLGWVNPPRGLHHLAGVLVVSGGPSSGKSFLATATSIDAALAGWDSFYFYAEMHKRLVRPRAARAVASRNLTEGEWMSEEAKARAIREATRVKLPDNWTLVNVGEGVTLQAVSELLIERVTDRPTLVVLDSVSSFVDAMAEGDPNDAHGLAHLRQVTKYVTGLRNLTHGHVAFIVLSEVNADGRVKGRSFDHRADWAIAMSSDPDRDHLKEVRVTKSWWGPTNAKVPHLYVLEWALGRLRYVEPAG